jgi:hypothetical protein
MRGIIVKSLGVAGLAASLAATSFGQADWSAQCIEPCNDTPFSNPYGVTNLVSQLMGVSMGVTGNVGYGDFADPDCGGDNDIPCFTTVQNINVIGRFGFMIGSEGSIQDQFPTDPGAAGFTDDFMVLTFGMPDAPGGSSCYASTVVDGTRTRFGSNGINLLFTGLSNRYFRCQSTDGDIAVQLTVSVVGDAVQFSWLLTNNGTDTHNVGLWFGAGLAMIANGSDTNGAEMSHWSPPTPTNTFLPGKLGYVVLSSGTKPPLTEHRYRRNVNPSGFPQVAEFLFGQTSPFGLKVENGPTTATMTSSGQSDATEVSEFVLGQQFFLLGRIQDDNNFPDVIFPPIDPNDPDLGSDVLMLDNTAFIQKYPEVPVAPGTARRITHYFRSTWGNSNYTPPYAAVVDAPRLIAEDINGTAGGQNGLVPNPMTIRVYIDNVGGYATVNQEFPLSDVRITLTLPQGLTLAAGETAVKTINTVAPRAIQHVQWQVEADGVAFGDLPYSVKVEPVPGPTKILNGTIRVASTPRLVVEADANLLTTPWAFSDTSWEAILQMDQPTDFQAFVWDPQQQGYVISTSAERGKGVWIVSNADHGSIPLGGNPQRPPDVVTGGRTIQLHSGWNMIGNPYQYAIRVGELVGVSASAPEQSHPWAALVAQGVVSGSLAYYDNDTGDYVFTTGNDALIQPNRGYWVFVATQQDLSISFPAVYQPGLPESFRSEEGRWVQNDRQWRLQIAARTNGSLDAQNFVGQARNAAEAARLKVLEPPITPVHNVQLAIEETVNGRPTQFAQSLTDRTGRKEWKVKATTTEAGTVHLTWPNIATVPKNTRFRITDLSTGTTRDMRQVSGYQFEAAANSTREFKIEAIPGGISQVVIGNVVVTRPGRGPNDAFAISYTLSNSATTTIRILSGSGREVYTVARGRADTAGENTATWALRDNAGRAVAPGAYRVEILAETSDGERVRRVVPINVIR